MRLAVVGGGLAGLAAALDLLDAGHEVSVYEARPTFGGAVQTLPEREGDPEPPPDNGQHIALGCFTEYLSFLDRIGEGRSYERRRLALPVIARPDEDGHAWQRQIRPRLTSLLTYSHLTLSERMNVVRTLTRLRSVRPSDDETFGALLREFGATDASVERFWDVFVRPALNLPADQASAAAGAFTVRTALLGGRGAADLVLPQKPLGAMHGDAAARTLAAKGATLCTRAQVEALDDLDADGIVLAVPPGESARLLGEEPPELEDSPIVSVHLWFDRRLLRAPMAALLESDAHWVFDRGALTGHPPERGQYLTVVSSGVPDLLEVRGRALVDRVADQVSGRLAPDAELLWSRVSREPHATIALRPGSERHRAGPETDRPDVVRAGAWTRTGWPATMESAVRSGRTAAATFLASVPSKIAT